MAALGIGRPGAAGGTERRLAHGMSAMPSFFATVDLVLTVRDASGGRGEHPNAAKDYSPEINHLIHKVYNGSLNGTQRRDRVIPCVKECTEMKYIAFIVAILAVA